MNMRQTQYDIARTWRENLSATLPAVDSAPAPVRGEWLWCGLPVDSPLGVSAGPLLNSRWLLYYAELGFDVLVYKTVRSVARQCYDLPNLVPVSSSQLKNAEQTLSASSTMNGTWAVSFGMPSQPPDIWQNDIAVARRGLRSGQLLVVSVVGTQDESITDPNASLDQLADDFAECARRAVDHGAHGIEANFSCPNVATADGQLFQQPKSAQQVAERIRDAIGTTPLVLKIGRMNRLEAAEEFVTAVGSYVDGLAMTNSISARVVDADGGLLFDGARRGICGDATRTASIAQVSLFRNAITNCGVSMDLVGVGGISAASHVRDYLDAGASSVALATAAMVDPEVGIKIRRELSESTFI